MFYLFSLFCLLILLLIGCILLLFFFSHIYMSNICNFKLICASLGYSTV